ncbi:MAG: hypothetical protein IKV85_00410 [Ruminococcus sp.]|nr:hypothetical protein [Ruminococcus sp.]
MTATTSSKKACYFGKRYKNNFRQNKRAFVIHIITELLGLPLLAVLGLIVTYVDSAKLPYETEEAIMSGCTAFLVVSIICIAISIFIGMTIALNHFNYLYKKSITDMNYALPLSGTQRFFADFLSGFTMYIAPAISAVILAIAIMGIGTPIVGEEMKYFWDQFPFILNMIIVVIIAMIQFYTLSVLAITFCGNTFESIFSIIAFNVLIPATVACMWIAVCMSYSYGIDPSAIFYKNIFTSTSPVGAACFSITYFSEIDYEHSTSFGSHLYIKWTIITLIITLIYLLGAYLLYRNRKAEDVSKPYVYKTAFYGIMSMSVFCILSLFITFDVFVAAGIVLCAIGWFIMEVITRRGFKKFWQAGLSFAAAVISVVILCNLFTLTKGFGISKNVPSASSVESVTIENYYLPIYDIVIRDKDIIKELVNLHEELVDRHFNQKNYSYNTTTGNHHSGYYDLSLSFRYSTYTGSTITRTYDMPSGMAAELMKKILLSDEYADAAYQNIFEYYDDNSSGAHINFLNKSGNYQRESADLNKFNALCSAYRKDLMNMTEDDLLNARYYGEIDYEYFVLETFENTISVLEDIGFECGDITTDELEESIGIEKYPEFYTDAKIIFESDYSKQEYLYYDDRYNTKTVADSITAFRCSVAITSRNATPTTTALELLNRSTKLVFGEKPIAIIHTNGEAYFLLDRGDNRELLEQLTIHNTATEDNKYGWD